MVNLGVFLRMSGEQNKGKHFATLFVCISPAISRRRSQNCISWRKIALFTLKNSLICKSTGNLGLKYFWKIAFDMTQNTGFLQPSIYGKFMFIFDSDSYQKESLRWQFLLSFRSGTFQYWASFMGHHPTFSLLSRPDHNHFPAWDHYYII